MMSASNLSGTPQQSAPSSPAPLSPIVEQIEALTRAIGRAPTPVELQMLIAANQQ